MDQQNNSNDPNAGQQAPGGTTPVLDPNAPADPGMGQPQTPAMPTDQPSTLPSPEPTPAPAMPSDQPAPTPEPAPAAPEPAPTTDGNTGSNPTGGQPGGMGGM